MDCGDDVALQVEALKAGQPADRPHAVEPLDPVGRAVQVDSGLGALGTAQIVYSATFPEAVRYSCINRKF